MVARAGEQFGVVDEPARRCPCVAVDGLIVVADAKERPVGPSEQPDEQQVRRGEVLELIDQ